MSESGSEGEVPKKKKKRKKRREAASSDSEPQYDSDGNMIEKKKR